jgi:mono/diheme cytochrome c family protein
MFLTCSTVRVKVIAAGLLMFLLWPITPLFADDLSPYKRWTYLATPRRAYEYFCASCHGLSGEGEGRFFPSELSPRPRDFTDGEAMSRLTDQDIERAITHGTAATGKSNLCPPWGKALGSDMVKRLVQYIRAFSSTDKEGDQ